MADAFAGRCGVYCGDCGFREKTGCPGCVEAKGEMFWGTCDVAVCCVERGHDHCGQCPDMPCEALTGLSYDAEQGDEGKRIANLKAWTTRGFQAWLASRPGM